MSDIICHIVGMNCKMKDNFKEKINKNYPNIIIKDLDLITNSIRNNPRMVELNEKLLKIKKNSIIKSDLIKERNNLWKDNVTSKLENILNNYSGKKIILLGLCTYHKNHRLKVKIDTINNFFIEIEPKLNAVEIIEYNLDKYKKYIINGSFPLRYIDHDFLIKQRERLINIYNNMKYVFKSLDEIIDWINSNINDEEKETTSLYIGLKHQFSEKINIDKKSYRKSRKDISRLLGIESENKIVGYTQLWLALISSIKDIDNYIEKGYCMINNIKRPCIKEKIKNGFDVLNTDCYLYLVDKDNFDSTVNEYKYKCLDSIHINKQKYIENIYNSLTKSHIKFIKFR